MPPFKSAEGEVITVIFVLEEITKADSSRGSTHDRAAREMRVKL